MVSGGDDHSTSTSDGDVNALPVPGRLLHSLAVGGEQFELWLATACDSGASELLGRAEKVALWFIETADAVDFSDPRWEALFLVRRCGAARYFAGYTTLFTFHNPLLGSKMRVCQALVLPGQQGRGLGREMLLAVYRLVRDRESVVELTVEDPAPGFQRLRDAVDLEWAVREGHVSAATLGALPSCEEVARERKITRAQAVFVLEALRYVQIVGEHRRAGAPGSAQSGAAFKAFRLDVKRRLFKGDKELRLLAAAHMQDELTRMFGEELQRFQAVLRTAERLQILPPATAVYPAP